MNVLLPISLCKECRKVKYELSAFNGCYQWHNSHPQLIEMTDKFGRNLDEAGAQNVNTCLDSVFLEAKTTRETKSAILITARDISAGTVLKCNAKVAAVDRLEIFTRAKQFSVNTNQHLTVAGYDDEDNIFSSMDGFRYDWTITSGTDIIRKLGAPDIDTKLAHQSDVFFVRSLKAGLAEVSVRLEEPGYEAVKVVAKKLTVVDPFIILPAEPVYILPTSKFQFSLAHLDMDNSTVENRLIKIPSKQFKWSTPNSDIGSIGDDGVFKSKVTEGLAEIHVVDQHMRNNTAEGAINVVFPYRLEVKIRDVTDSEQLKKLHAGDDVEFMTAWAQGSDFFAAAQPGELNELDLADTHILIEEHYYSLTMNLFDKEGHKLTLTDNLRFESLNLESQYIEVLKRNKIGSEVIIKTKKIADDQVKVNSLHKLDEIIAVDQSEKYSKFASHLTQEKELVITKPVKIQHPTNFVLLPFLPAGEEAHGSGEVWSLSARGGSGAYMWKMVDSKIATVHGSATVKSVSIGKTQLVVRDHKNPKNWDAIEVEVAQINRLLWLEEQSELKAKSLPSESTNKVDQATFGEVRTVSLYALDSQGRKFTNCTAVRPSFEVKGEGIVKLQAAADAKPANKYEQVKSYLQGEDSQALIALKQKLDESPQVTLIADLAKAKDAPKLSREMMLYNNFGICAQRHVQAESEGLARLKASFTIYEYFNGPGRVLESEYAEIAVYNQLTSLLPKYKPFMGDLYSANQVGQEFASFEQFYQEWKLVSQFGSSVVWKIAGGTNFWHDQQENYVTAWRQESLTKSKQEAVRISKVRETTTEFDLSLECLAPGSESLAKSQRIMIHLSQNSIGTRRLLRPAQHTTSVEVHCEPPKSVKLTWSQDYLDLPERPLRMLPRSSVIANERTHYVLTNSEHSVRYLMLDSDSMASFNSSSVLTNVESSNTSLASVSAFRINDQSAKSAKNYLADVKTGVYDRRHVTFKNITGTVYLSAKASQYFADFMGQDAKGKGGYSMFGGSASSAGKDAVKGPYKESMKSAKVHSFGHDGVADRMRVEIVKNVDVEPKYKSLYIGQSQQTFRLRILHGSGHFSVTLNDTRLVEMQHKDREIFLTPKDLGGLKITIEDLELPTSQNAEAELLISDIAKLSLYAPRTLIENGDEMELLVSAFDQHMREFDDDQYALMTFGIETEMTGVMRSNGLQTSPVPGQNRKFKALGNEPGIYQSTAYTFRFPYLQQAMQQAGKGFSDTAGKKHTVVSDMLRIEVFPLLEIYPNNLLITPNMRYTLQIVGGPQTSARAHSTDGSHIEIKFEIENSDIATVDQFREVTGHNTGDTYLKYEIIQLRTQVQSNSADPSGKGVQQQQQSRVVSKKTVPIRVRLVTEIEIPYSHQRQIYSDSFIKMNAVLKFGNEYFHHGIAPISYAWNCTNSRTLQLQIPSKQELAQSHGVASNLVMTSRYIRDNLKNDNKAEFFTSFNSSSVYAQAQAEQEGDAVVTVLLAIEYPEKYRRDQNWFKTAATLKVVSRLAIAVPESSTHGRRQTHMYLVPPNTETRIETNRQTRLKLGYSQQSVFDYSTQSYKYTDATSPIIQLVNDESIRTFDKYGKVTVMVEEGQAFSDQIVMLNVKIADIYTMATVKSYDALSLPLGSSLSLPIHLQDEHAHMFAEKISGVGVGVILSHPRVLSVQLDHYNQTMTVQSQGSGECNIVLYLEDQPHIFDVIRVKVSSVVQPLSPVSLHVGGEVNFRVESTDGSATVQDQSGSQVVWSSSNPSQLQIDATTGKAFGKREGKVDVLLSNHVNAASIVHISKVAYAQLDQKSQLIINTDQRSSQGMLFSGGGAPEYKVRIKLFLDTQTEEVLPTLQFDGITLVRQNIGLRCESENPDYVLARGVVNDLEGFFCVMTFNSGADVAGMPKHVKITANAFALDSQGKQIYSDKVAEFEMQLASEIVVESKFKNNIVMCNAKREENIKVFSSSDFKVAFNYGAPEDSDLVRYQVEPVSKDSNEYRLTLVVPNQVSHAFNANVILSHQFATKSTTLNLQFTADEQCARADESSSYWGGGSSSQVTTLAQQQDSQYQPPAPPSDGQSKGTSWKAYLIFILALLIGSLFIMMQCCNIDPSELYFRMTGGQIHHQDRRGYGHYGYGNSGFREVPRPYGAQGDGGIRASRATRSKPLSRDASYSSIQKNSTMSRPGFKPVMRQGRPLNLDDSNRQSQSARQSVYSRVQDSDKYY